MHIMKDIMVTHIRFMAGTLAIISWISLLLQWILLRDRMDEPTNLVRARYFSYFTLISNILVALCYSAWFVFPVMSVNQPTNATLLTAVCLYIIIVALVYHLILRKSGGLKGLHRLVSDFHHSWIPICYVLLWQCIVEPGIVKTLSTGYFLILPILYLGYILLLGSKTSQYPYPFVDVKAIGLGKVVRNCFLLTLIFALLGYLLILWKS